MINLDDWKDRQFTDLIAEMVNEINNLNIELEHVNAELQKVRVE